MAKFLVTFNDVIDEIIDISGFSIMTDKEVLRFEELANSITWPFTYEFEEGTELYYSNGESFLSSIIFKEITQDEAKMVTRLFNDDFGFFINEDFLKNIINEEDDDSFDEDDEEKENDFYHDY